MASGETETETVSYFTALPKKSNEGSEGACAPRPAVRAQALSGGITHPCEVLGMPRAAGEALQGSHSCQGSTSVGARERQFPGRAE